MGVRIPPSQPKKPASRTHSRSGGFSCGQAEGFEPVRVRSRGNAKRFPAQHARSEAMQRSAAAEKAAAESLRPISATGSPHPNFPAKSALRDVPKVPGKTSRSTREDKGRFSGMSQNLPPKDRHPRPLTTKSALHLENISSVPKSEPLATTKCRVAPAGRALSLSRVPHAKKAT